MNLRISRNANFTKKKLVLIPKDNLFLLSSVKIANLEFLRSFFDHFEGNSIFYFYHAISDCREDSYSYERLFFHHNMGLKTLEVSRRDEKCLL